MYRPPDMTTDGSAIGPVGSGDQVRAQRIASDVQTAWKRGQQPNAALVLEQHPELRRYRTIALDLAHEEFLQRVENGESVTPEEFSGRFPSMAKSLCMLIRVARVMEADPALQAALGNVDWPDVGSEFLGFQLVAELGRGTFGRVYLARETAVGSRYVALKLEPGGAAEADLLGRIEHENIVPVLTVKEDETSGLSAVAMPYLGRTTLLDVLDRLAEAETFPTQAKVFLDVISSGNPDIAPQASSNHPRVLRRGSYVSGAIHVAAELAEALAFAHTRGVCHRDLKPSNVLLSRDGRALLLDFNLSTGAATAGGKVGGTLPYMAPEQLKQLVLTGAEHEAISDPRSDIFSLGVMFYEMLAGELPFAPFSDETSLEGAALDLLKRQQQRARPLREINPRVGQRLARLVTSCLSYDPEERPQTAALLAGQLRHENQPSYRTRRWLRDHAFAVTLTMVVSLALAVGGGTFFAMRDPYSVRQYKLGVARYELGDLAGALEYFDASLTADYHQADAFYARGLVRMHQHDFLEAADDFAMSERIIPSGKVCALRGFCLAKGREPASALAAFIKARGRGYTSADMLNNEGYCCSVRGQHTSASGRLHEALDCPTFPPEVYLNLIANHLSNPEKTRVFPADMVSQARLALKGCPPSASLFALTGSYFALASEEEPSLADEAVECFRRGRDCGVDLDNIAIGLSNTPFASSPAFQSLLAEPADPRPIIPTDFLVWPDE